MDMNFSFLSKTPEKLQLLIAGRVARISIRQEQFVTEAVEKALPITLSCSLLISAVCSLLFSKAIAGPIEKISASTGQMMKLGRGVSCPIMQKMKLAH